MVLRLAGILALCCFACAGEAAPYGRTTLDSGTINNGRFEVGTKPSRAVVIKARRSGDTGVHQEAGAGG
jgi:hypothetical protein